MSQVGRPPAQHAISLILNDFLKADAWAISLYDGAQDTLTDAWGRKATSIRSRLDALREAWRSRRDGSVENHRTDELLRAGRECLDGRHHAFLDAAAPLDPTRTCLVTAIWKDAAQADTANEFGPKILDALREFYTLQLRTEQAERLAAAVKTTLDGLNAACVITDRDGNIAYANRASQATLERLASMRGSRGKVADQLLRELVATNGCEVAAVSQAPDSGRLPVARLKTLPGLPGPAYIIRLDGTAQDQGAPGGGPFFSIFFPNGDGLPEAEVLAAGLRLSPSESRLAARVIRGKSIQQAGEELGLSEQTARTYLKRIFAKIGISRQTQLSAAAATMYLPVGDCSSPHNGNGTSTISPPRIRRKPIRAGAAPAIAISESNI